MDPNSNASSLMIELFGEDSENESEGSRQTEAENNNDEVSQNNEENPTVSATNNGETLTGPKTCMLYATLENLFNDYQEHARREGFTVVKRTNRKAGEDEFKYALFVCSKFGKPTSQFASKKVMCKARVNAKRVTNGSWVVTKMCSDHNHDLDLSYSILMPAHRSISVQIKRQLEANDRAGLRPCKSIRLLEVQSGGPDNLGCLPKDCRNFIEERKRLRLGDGDAEAVRTLFVRLKAKDPNFYQLMDIDDESRLRNVLWIHPRSIAAYEEFHDVVSFDTTYLVNRHQMSFAAFVGVNHHGHSILLGCALVTREDAASFKWIFSNWVEAMGGVYPTGIITNQCESIKNALKDIMPYSIHRYCIWHIMTKLPVKFRCVADYNEVIKEWKGIVYDNLSIEIFESKWGEFITKHRLENNKWLQDLYNEREKWVPVYLNHTFWAGMISTQRSEGMHAYFDEFLHSRCTLMQFIKQYEMAMSSKIQKEFIADFDSKNKIHLCSTEYPWEAQFQKLYTNSMFMRVQDSISRMKYCISALEEEDSTAGISKFKVLERRILNDFFRKEYTYMVEYRRNGYYISCNCQNFEFKGILCCHIFEVLRNINVETVNDRYILRRWRKDVQRRCSSIFFAGGYPHMTPQYKKFQEVKKFFQDNADLAFGNVEKMDFIKRKCMEIRDQLENWNSNTATNASDSGRLLRSNVIGSPILNLQVTKTKGRPTEKRLKSCLEKGGRGRGRGRTTRGSGGNNGGGGNRRQNCSQLSQNWDLNM